MKYVTNGPEWWQPALDTLSAGGVVAMPTDTVFGLCANALDPEAVAKVLAIKGRGTDHPVPVFVDGFERAQALLAPGQDKLLMEIVDAWPGPVTAILVGRPGLPAGVLGSDGGVGLRIPAADHVTELIAETGLPLTGTSANPTGAPPPSTAEEVLELFRTAKLQPDLVVSEKGWRLSKAPSLVIDYRYSPPKILRGGPPSIP